MTMPSALVTATFMSHNSLDALHGPRHWRKSHVTHDKSHVRHDKSHVTHDKSHVRHDKSHAPSRTCSTPHGSNTLTKHMASLSCRTSMMP